MFVTFTLLYFSILDFMLSASFELVIIVILSYYFKKEFIHENIILGLLILYILYYLYNLL